MTGAHRSVRVGYTGGSRVFFPIARLAKAKWFWGGKGGSGQGRLEGVSLYPELPPDLNLAIECLRPGAGLLGPAGRESGRQSAPLFHGFPFFLCGKKGGGNTPVGLSGCLGYLRSRL